MGAQEKTVAGGEVNSWLTDGIEVPRWIWIGLALTLFVASLYYPISIVRRIETIARLEAEQDLLKVLVGSAPDHSGCITRDEVDSVIAVAEGWTQSGELWRIRIPILVKAYYGETISGYIKGKIPLKKQWPSDTLRHKPMKRKR